MGTPHINKDSILHVMKEYFDELPQPNCALITESIGMKPHLKEHMPVIISAVTNWEIFENPRRFSKTFSFEHYPQIKAFIDGVMEFQEEFGHHGIIKISGNEINIEVYTHGVNDITELDQEYIRTIEHIYDDINHYFLTTCEDDNTYDI